MPKMRQWVAAGVTFQTDTFFRRRQRFRERTAIGQAEREQQGIGEEQ